MEANFLIAVLYLFLLNLLIVDCFFILFVFLIADIVFGIQADIYVKNNEVNI